MWSSQLVTSGMNCVPGLFCPCNIVFVFEMYSLIGCLIVIHDREPGMLTGTFAHALRFKYGQFKRQTGLRTVQKRFVHVSVACMFVACALPVNST